MITRIQPGARMSEAVIHGDTIYLSGQVGESEDYEGSGPLVTEVSVSRKEQV